MSHLYPTTRWTAVLEVIQNGKGDEAFQALSQFLEQYRPVVCFFFLRKGCSREEAEDLTQSFFLDGVLKKWDDQKGFLFIVKRRPVWKFP